MRAKELEYPDFEQQQLDFENQKINFDLISDNCQQYLQGMRQAGRCLFRGIRGDKENPQDLTQFIGSSRDSRYPTGSHVIAQTEFDSYLQKLDVKALRSKSTFITSDYSFAGDFGTEFAIFPFDGCPFAWSRKFKDLILHPEDIRLIVNPNAKPKHMQYMLNGTTDVVDSVSEHEKLHRFMDHYQIDDNDLISAIRSRHEIWFTGKYVGIRWQLNEEEILKFIGVN